MSQQDRQYETTYYDAQEVRRAAAARNGGKKRKRRNPRRPWVYLLCVLLVSCFLAGVGWLLFSDMCSLNKDYKVVDLTVEEGDSVRDVAKKLKEEGLIRYRWFFNMTSGVFHAKKWIDPGTYELNSDMDYRALIWKMHDYDRERLEKEGLVKVTIVEGMSVREVIDLLVENGISTKAELEEACANFPYEDYSFLDDELIGSVDRMEGYLFPDTYEFNPNKSAVYDIETMLVGFVNHMDGETMTAIGNSGYSMQEIITIASFIEKEATADPDERAKVSSVLHNRLEHPDANKGGRCLQLCSSINYVMKKDGVPTFDTEIESAYNTYKHEGLTPTPICSPSAGAIYAALHPADTDYYFFALGKDDKTHFFTDFNSHLSFTNSSEYQPIYS